MSLIHSTLFCLWFLQVELYTVITGHGSDENGCGEFCVTSHHFLVNGVFNNTRIFDSAGSNVCERNVIHTTFALYCKSPIQYYSSKSWSTFDDIWLTGHRYMFCSRSYVGALGCGIGSALGCAMRVREGAVPNEHGTWLYGRGGWCDGLQVNPWRIDITKQVQYLSMFYKSTAVLFVS